MSRFRARPRLRVARGFAAVLAQDRLELSPQPLDSELELAAVVGVLVDLPGPEHALADREACVAELGFGAGSLGLGLEVALEG